MTIKFYSQEEVELIKSYISKGKPNKENIKALSKKLKRTPSAVMNKYMALKREMGVVSNRKKNGVPRKATGLAEGTRLEFKASHIVIEKNRLIVYI